MITNITWTKIPVQVYFGDGYNFEITGNCMWLGGDYKYSQHQPYFAFTIVRGTATGIPRNVSIISQQIYPQFRFIDPDDESIFATFSIIGNYNRASLWSHDALDESYIMYRATYNANTWTAISSYNNNYFAGYIPDSERDEYWDVSQNWICQQSYWQIDLLADGYARAMGVATKDYIVRAYWPRWELPDYDYFYSNDQRTAYCGYSPKHGVYEPKDGVTGTMSFGAYNEDTGLYEPSFGYNREFTEGQVAIWR